MADGSKIEWTDATWSPITGCSVLSPGCKFCYAMKLAGGRMKHHWSREGLTEDSKAGPVWNGEVRFNEAWLDQPLRWKRSRSIFVCAHSDLFHSNVPQSWIERVYAVMAAAPQHRFQVLTKRPLRAQGFYDYGYLVQSYIAEWAGKMCEDGDRVRDAVLTAPWPLDNIWIGVSVEDRKRLDRIDQLREIPAAVRFLSLEPLLEDLGEIDLAGISWVIVGGESGPNARPMHPDWARSIRDQCQDAGVAFHFKQWGEWLPGEIDKTECGPPFWKMPESLWQDGKRGMRFDRVDRPSVKVVGWSPDGQPIPADTDQEQKAFRDQHGAPKCVSVRVGKKSAGRMLDGRVWDGMPA
ncbi:MAG: phage Gp37/Gp68 family protein [Alphaproteobacteria bacterium]|nr:phage Gp37/Gp68 family protein [Alphaproteobacteria bacterium]